MSVVRWVVCVRLWLFVLVLKTKMCLTLGGGWGGGRVFGNSVARLADHISDRVKSQSSASQSQARPGKRVELVCICIGYPDSEGGRCLPAPEESVRDAPAPVVSSSQGAVAATLQALHIVADGPRSVQCSL